MQSLDAEGDSRGTSQGEVFERAALRDREEGRWQDTYLLKGVPPFKKGP